MSDPLREERERHAAWFRDVYQANLSLWFENPHDATLSAWRAGYREAIDACCALGWKTPGWSDLRAKVLAREGEKAHAVEVDVDTDSRSSGGTRRRPGARRCRSGETGSQMKKTPWFSSNQRPVRVGDYQIRWPGGQVHRARWDGRDWREWMPGIAEYSCFAYFLVGDEQWRGLTAEAARQDRPSKEQDAFLRRAARRGATPVGRGGADINGKDRAAFDANVPPPPGCETNKGSGWGNPGPGREGGPGGCTNDKTGIASLDE